MANGGNDIIPVVAILQYNIGNNDIRNDVSNENEKSVMQSQYNTSWK